MGASGMHRASHSRWVSSRLGALGAGVVLGSGSCGRTTEEVLAKIDCSREMED